MSEFFIFLSSNPTVATVLVVFVCALIASATTIYLVAFFQGREISFWPPKIGPKPESLHGKASPPSALKEIGSMRHPLTPEELGKHYMREHAGIVEIFKSLEACRADMRGEFEKAKNIRLLLQIGRRELGDGEPSYFWSLAKNKTTPDVHITILRASEESPFLSEKRAKLRSTHVEQWQEDLSRLSRQIALLKQTYGVPIEERKHCEPYLWRIFMFDDTAYVSAYLYERDNDSGAVVYKIRKGDNSLFSIFNKYFEYLWKKYGDTPDWSTFV